MGSREKANRVQLTPRDLALLDLLFCHALLSFGQLRRFAFPGRDHSTVMNRIKKLEGAGFLSRGRIHRVRHPMFSGEVGVVFQITNKGVRELQKLNPRKMFREQIPSIHGRQIDHDLIVVEVAEGLKKEMPGAEYRCGSFVEGVEPGAPRPDGVFRNPLTKALTAIEVELTMKSADRIRAIIVAYRVRGKFQKVIYFVGSLVIGKRIASEVRGYPVARLEDFQDRLFEIRLLPTTQEMTNEPVQNEEGLAA